MDEEIIRSVALFFYLNLFDSKQAFSASQKTLASWRDLGSTKRSDLIPIAIKMLRRSRRFRFLSASAPEGDFSIPEHIHLEAWREFRRTSDPAEFEAVLWTQVLGFSDEEAAAGLGVTEGTVRHRVNRGLRELGRML